MQNFQDYTGPTVTPLALDKNIVYIFVTFILGNYYLQWDWDHSNQLT